jgi:hypothetical protein
MNGRRNLDDFLRTDPRDVGCAQATEMLHVYAELVAAGEPAGQRYPGMAAHLHACGPAHARRLSWERQGKTAAAGRANCMDRSTARHP